jgi:hypothetical protein
MALRGIQRRADPSNLAGAVYGSQMATAITDVFTKNKSQHVKDAVGSSGFTESLGDAFKSGNSSNVKEHSKWFQALEGRANAEKSLQDYHVEQGRIQEEARQNKRKAAERNKQAFLTSGKGRGTTEAPIISDYLGVW